MRRAVLAGALLLAACGGSSAPAQGPDEAPSTALTIEVWPQGKSKTAAARVRTLRCDPTGGTLPHPHRACRRLAALRAPFREVPRDVACAEIYGGPAVARVLGRSGGQRVATSFERTDGCEIARWERVGFLFAASPGR